jgi:hypothetical protein
MRGPPLTPPKEGKDCGNVMLAKLAGIDWGPSCVGVTKYEGKDCGEKDNSVLKSFDNFWKVV